MKSISYAAIFILVSASLPTMANNSLEESGLAGDAPSDSSVFSTESADENYVDAASETELIHHQDQELPKESFDNTDSSESLITEEEISYIGDDEKNEYDESSYTAYIDESEHQETEPVTYQDMPSPQKDSLRLTELPGEEINFKLKLFKKTLHHIDGKATSDLGKILFKSRLMPNNEVKLSVKLKQGDLDDIELIGYFDIAHFTMELDGSNAVLNKHHKELLSILDTHLRTKLPVHYSEYDFPEHAFMLMQMLSYWSVSPEGYVHEKREILASH